VQDWFVGTIKGVIVGLQPNTRVIDITHAIPPGDVEAGAFALAASFAFFPKHTVHLVVIDPGVGTSRAALAVQTERYYFIGPDNGVLSWALAQDPPKTVRRLENPTYFLSSLSQTFHGRDLFAPVAAHLSAGVSIRDLGPEIREYARLPWPETKQEHDRIYGVVIYIERFGNAITNIHGDGLPWPAKTPLQVRVGRRKAFPVCTAYGSVKSGRPLGIFGSTGYLELAINGGSATQAFGLVKGEPIELQAVGGASRDRREL